MAFGEFKAETAQNAVSIFNASGLAAMFNLARMTDGKTSTLEVNCHV